MPARVHALVVAQSGDRSRIPLTRTLQALQDQSTPPDAVTLVVIGNGAALRAAGAIGPAVDSVVEARAGTGFAEAIRLADQVVPDDSAVWLLAQDTAPAHDALELLRGALERSPSALIAAPKLVREDDDREIVSLGVTMTRFGRAVELVTGELDQGQHDTAEDALAADVRGMLLRAGAPRSLRPDPALGGADEGLDLGVRARLGGARVVLVPSARVAVRPDGPAALPRGTVARSWAIRRAQLHRRLAYAPPFALPLHWLSILPLALWRSVTHLIGKRPGEVWPEWGAGLAAMLRWGAVVRSRNAIRSFRAASWSSVAPLRITRAQLHQRLDDGHGSERGSVSELRFFSGGGAWVVLAALAVSLGAFVPMLAWPTVGGGALLPLRRTVGSLWQDAAWGMRGIGADVVGPADPFAAVVAVLGSLWPGAPSFALVLLWLAALPLAVLGGWFAATRVTDRASLRILGGVLWALAPTFLSALIQGRPAAVLLHLLLPWVFHSAVVAHRSWGAAGAASILAAAALACAPSLAPAFVFLWMLALLLMLVRGRLRESARLFWLLIPAAALFVPLALWQARHGDLWALLADPGAVVPDRQLAADTAGRTVVATGFPSADRGGWDWLAGSGGAAWAPVLLAPLALLALVSALSPRWRAGGAMLLTCMAGLASALFSIGVVVAFAHGEGAQLWPGSGLSLAWLGLAGAALVTLDTVVLRAPMRATAALVAGVSVGVCALPALLAVPTGHAEVRSGAASTLPALVAAEGGDDTDLGTLVLTPQNDGSLSVDLVWGASATLGAQTTLLSTATQPRGASLADDAVDLLSARDYDAAAALAERGIGFVLLAPASGEGDRARVMRETGITAIDQRAGLVTAGETGRGSLWRVDRDIAPRSALTESQQAASRIVVGAQLLVMLVALLLSIPTRASRRAARSRSRIVGRMPEEPLVLPRRRPRDDADRVPAALETDGSDDVAQVGEPGGESDDAGGQEPSGATVREARR